VTARQAAQCSVCFGTFQLVVYKDRPIRHGFNAYGVQHGQHGGFHTGPCQGVRFPHFGVSTEGTVWALGLAQETLVDVTEAHAKHQTRPVLTWHRPIFRSYSKPREPQHKDLSPGDAADFRTGVPSYEDEWKDIEHKLTRRIAELKDQILIYEAAIKTWKPCSPVPVPAKVPLVHHPRTYQRVSSGTSWVGPACRRTDPYQAQNHKTSTDPKLVTCPRCIKNGV